MQEPEASGSGGAQASQPPLVSILVRSMDRQTLARALDSIAAQTWPHLEIVVAAACGHEHRPLPDAWRGRPLRLVLGVSDRRLSRPEAANLCLESARGEWLNFLDDDDEFLPEHIETVYSAPRPASARVVYSKTHVIDEANRSQGYCGFAGYHAQLYYQSRSTPTSTFFHRSLVDEGARFDPEFDLIEDHDFFVNLASRTEFHFVDVATGVWHAHSGASGAGFGSNYTPEKLESYYAKLRHKWAALFQRWLSQPEALLFLGQHGLRSGDPKSALPHLERALALLPNDVNALNLCGIANMQAGNLVRAESLLAQAVRIAPTHQPLLENLSLVRTKRAAASGTATRPNTGRQEDGE